MNDKVLKETKLAFIGCGVMAESIIAGVLRKKLVVPNRIFGSHPRGERRSELEKNYKIQMLADNREAVESLPDKNSIIVLCVKPQRIKSVLAEIKGAILPEQLVISIVAGATVEMISDALDNHSIVRAMPNTPSQIGAGMTTWTCTSAVEENRRAQVKELLTALGKEIFVETENMIDMATSLSATGPTYIFMVMEALTDAGVHLGFSREMAKELVQETMLGSVLFAMESHKHPAELRNMVTSPGGTSADAIYQMEKGGLRTVLSKAVYSAYQKAVALGQKK